MQKVKSHLLIETSRIILKAFTVLKPDNKVINGKKLRRRWLHKFNKQPKIAKKKVQPLKILMNQDMNTETKQLPTTNQCSVISKSNYPKRSAVAAKLKYTSAK